MESMLDLIKLYIVPACVGIAFFIAIRVLLGLFAPNHEGTGILAALVGAAIFGSFSRKKMLEDKGRGYRS
jgi:hypothetical protein